MNAVDYQPLFQELAATDGSRHQEVRDRLVTEHLPLAHHIADRFAERGESVEDLRQVAALGLINAVDRFDVTRGIDFLAFAVPTITGEVRRYLRDLGWAVRVPRRLKELCTAIDGARVELARRTGRTPTPSEVARHLGIELDEVYEGLHAASAYHLLSLDEHDELVATEGGLVSDDPALEVVELQHALDPMLRGLPKRERRIIVLRFFRNMTQSQIADSVGVSQMHVSRLLSRSLARLRDLLDD
ncbi:SigB/SigF/SigG family RNA polymerase sigma factor [Saccharothrix longispora]|uniref:SigB/SigF/SigG family RNA polymerase sigma factor n=1 Tax=Saccharothrix longispora TaxID=33920 RepID=UPI0028FD5D56|nr:SigB/SigF/SigG family RNA polymerase sigma factor [Saccharothrix longispora]MBY8848691.1 SigB/SigF/SigG family RNA polymerase sigma factor [Saccharothrix sp. MB29]MDU0288108.1 SigB/SigF/SigG family RNA polymerase sigma factor [Saccharothrix longispora]